VQTLSPFFERFFILGGPRGTRQKKLQNLDSTNQKHTMKNICARKIGVMSLLVTGCCYD
jgi:hypothetical protein